MREPYEFVQKISTTNACGLTRHSENERLTYIDGWVQTPSGFVIVYGEPRSERSNPLAVFRIIVDGVLSSRSMETRYDPTLRSLAILAGRFAREVSGRNKTVVAADQRRENERPRKNE
jgi:hypothetical protein